MLRPHGYAIIVDPDAPDAEFDTIRCCHCHKIVRMKPGHSMQGFSPGDASNVGKPDPAGMCYRCMQPVCGRCADLGTCTPFEKTMEQMESADLARRRLFDAMGI